MIQPGLDRISRLLKDIPLPWKAIHVAGTNGKGSTCHYAATLLRRRAVTVGMFSSPHLVDRWDCIEINQQPVKESRFKEVERGFTRLNCHQNINASPFEILTATAFALFSQAKVNFGVVEVGMGGTLDATNVLNNQVVSVITKIAMDHENFLGTTIEEIARHKAGILRPNVPYIVNPMNSFRVQAVIDEYAKEIGAGPRLVGDTPYLREKLYSLDHWKMFAKSTRPFQQDNAVLAFMAVNTALKSQGKKELAHEKIAEELTKVRATKPGRMEFKYVVPVFGHAGNQGRKILVDGAHNPDAALALNDIVMKERRRWHVPWEGKSKDHVPPPTNGWVVTWVLAMTEGKDVKEYLKTILRPGDNVITTTFGPVDGMPWVKPMDPSVLFETARSVQPHIRGFAMPKEGVLRALYAAKYMSAVEEHKIVVLTGSLYLVGDLHRELIGKTHWHFWSRSSSEDDRRAMRLLHQEEQARVLKFLGSQPDNLRSDGRAPDRSLPQEKETLQEKKSRLLAELEATNKEMGFLAIQELNEPPRNSRQHAHSSHEAARAQDARQLPAPLDDEPEAGSPPSVRYSSPRRPPNEREYEREYDGENPGFFDRKIRWQVHNNDSQTRMRQLLLRPRGLDVQKSQDRDSSPPIRKHTVRDE